MEYLPSELKWQLYYELDAPSAAALCSVSKEFSDFCHERAIRIATLANYYKSFDAQRQQEAFVKLLQEGEDARYVEHLEALITLNPKWLNLVGVLPTMTIDSQPLMIAALWQLGSNPMLLVPHSGKRGSALLIDKQTPILAHIDPRPFSLALRLARPRAMISKRVWELLPSLNTGEMIYLPFALPEQVLVNMLYSSVKSIEYNSARELLERGVNPVRNQNMYDDLSSPLDLAISMSDEYNGLMMLWLILHYVSPDPQYLTQRTPLVKVFPDTAIGKYVGALRNINVSFKNALKLEYPILLYLHAYHALPHWDNLSFWQSKWKQSFTDVPPNLDVADLRLAYRQMITTPLLKLSVNNHALEVRADKEYENGMLTIFRVMNAKVNIRERTLLGYQDKVIRLNRVDTMVQGIMPTCNYTLHIRNELLARNELIEFNSLQFLKGALRACRELRVLPLSIMSQLAKIHYD